MRLLWTIAAYALSLCILAPVVFLIVLFLAGPHTGLLPEFFEAVILVRGLAFITALADLGCAKSMETALITLFW